MSYYIAAETGSLNLNVGTDLVEYKRLLELDDRRLYLYGEIESSMLSDDCGGYCSGSTMTGTLVEHILDFNRLDAGIEPAEREPIRLYINSPGGDVSEGFSLVSAMELSKTPIYTINVGEWCSMAFLIGITGTKRFSLPSSIFMMHEPSGLTVGKFSDMEDKVEFNRRFNENIIKKHIMQHGKMPASKYSKISKKDFYMLASDALEYGFIDEIVDDIDTIL